MESSSIVLAFSNIYVAIFALFCFKLLIKVSLALLTHFYIVRGNRKEAARIAEEIYGISQDIRISSPLSGQLWSQMRFDPGDPRDVLPSDSGSLSNVVSASCKLAVYVSTGVSKRREFCGTSLPWDLRNALYGDHICHTFQGGSWADRSPLHDAAFHGRLLTVKTLIAQGFNVNILTVDRITPLHEACLGGHVSCAKVLLENRARINIVTVDGITPLYNACSSGSVACVSMLLDNGAKPELETQLAFPLHEAVVRGHRECAEMLIAYGADIEKELQNRGTPLYLACAHQKTDCVRRLLELGANVNHGKQRDTPLHAAARGTSEDIVKLLIDYGANVRYKNMEGKYPIELSAPRSPVERALLVAEGPASLAQLCRLSIRKTLGSSCLQIVPRLQLPNRLIQFLLYR